MDPKYDPHNRFQQRFDPTVDAIIRRGYVIARQFVSELKTAHVLLSALEEPRAVEVIQMFATPPIDLDRLRAALEARADCEDRYFSEERPTAQSAYCVQALKHAFEESARRGRQDAIGVPHLLYGLARQTTETTGAPQSVRSHRRPNAQLDRWRLQASSESQNRPAGRHSLQLGNDQSSSAT